MKSSLKLIVRIDSGEPVAIRAIDGLKDAEINKMASDLRNEFPKAQVFRHDCGRACREDPFEPREERAVTPATVTKKAVRK